MLEGKLKAGCKNMTLETKNITLLLFIMKLEKNGSLQSYPVIGEGSEGCEGIMRNEDDH
jgi:hypothetical protein